MIRNYLKVALRNILKHKFFAAINILGMTVGITACLLILIYVLDELSYDRFHAKADRMYHVGLHGRIGDQDIVTATTCPPMAEGFQQEIPGVAEATRIANLWDSPIIRYGENSFKEERLFYADSNFFQFFSFQLIDGDPRKALVEPNSIVLTEALAKKYFASEPAIGKIVTLGSDKKAFKVTGVSKDCPRNSHFIYNALLSSSSAEHLKTHEWLNNYLQTYIILDPKTTRESVESRFPGMVVKYVGPELEKFMGVTVKDLEGKGGAYGYFLTPITDIHLKSSTRDSLEPAGNMTYVVLFGAIGVFIIAIACINFMNLSTARSVGRAKEVGLRKTLGSLRGQMIWQFLAESILHCSVAVLLALVLCYLLLPQFNLLAGKRLDMSLFMRPQLISYVAVLAFGVGIIAGSYPAFYLTSFHPVEVLKGKVRAGLGSKRVRSGLVVFQFALSIFLIIFTAIVYQQISYMQKRDLGIDKHNVIVIYGSDRLGNNRDAFKNAITQQAGFVKSSYTNNSFPGINSTTVFKTAGSEQDHLMGVYYADYDHQDVMRFQMKEGRFFSREFPSDSTGIVLNEAAVREFGYAHPLQEDVIAIDNNKRETLRIVGVVRDFNFESLKTQVRPMAIRFSKQNWCLMARYEGSAAQAVSSLEKLWKQNVTGEPLDYTFLDQSFDEQFRSEQRLGNLFSVFSGLAIFIACLGLFALAAFAAEQRTKEIGIRKAMGATVPGLTLMISKEFTVLVIVAFCVAVVPTWFTVKWWLESFTYRMDLQLWVFAAGGVTAVVVAWVTVSYQSLKAAATSPVTSLRYE